MSKILSLVDSSLDPAGVEEILVGMTVRVDPFDKERVDLLARFLGVSRQRFLNSAVQDAIESAIEALSDSGLPEAHTLFDNLASLDDQEAIESSM
jgi:hypothetical protein